MDKDDKHDCPKVGCGQRVAFEVLACKPHWFELPAGLRRMISKAWRDGDLAEHTRLRKLAVTVLNGSVVL